MALVLAVLTPGPAAAQQAPAAQVSVPVVQVVPQKSAGMRLNDALNRLAKSPQDVEALVAAGQASLELGDAQAAIGFYRRALTLQPGSARIKAGLAGAYVLSEDPFTAIELFDEAEKDGPIAPERLADRGLAFDLVGDNQTAQFYYRQSLARAPSDETLRRLALSQAIARDRKGMDQTLAPLLQKQDKAAWRTRAFGLAILGQADEAESIAKQTMPAEMATAITAYLRYMPRLTAAQQAAAANLGRFPRASEIGNDDPRLAQYSRSRVKVAASGPAATPIARDQTKPADRGKKNDRGKKDEAKARQVAAKPAASPQPVPPPEPQVARETTPSSQPLRQVVAPVRANPPPAPVAPVSVASAAPAPTPGFATLAQGEQKTVSGFDLARSAPPAAATSPAPTPTPTPPVVAAPPAKPTSIDEAFADLAPPSREVEPQAGAVDVRRIKPVTPPPVKEQVVKGKEPAAKGKDVAAKGKEPSGKGKDAKLATPSHPSRIWVQLATGRNKSALGFDWRKLSRENTTLFKGMKPNVAAWGQANRLLAGPFATTREANAFLAQLKKAGVGGAFVWTSPAGQVVDALAAAN